MFECLEILRPLLEDTEAPPVAVQPLSPKAAKQCVQDKLASLQGADGPSSVVATISQWIADNGTKLKLLKTKWWEIILRNEPYWLIPERDRPCPVLSTTEELSCCLENLQRMIQVFDEDEDSEKRDAITAKVWQLFDAKERILKVDEHFPPLLLTKVLDDFEPDLGWKERQPFRDLVWGIFQNFKTVFTNAT